MCLNCLPVLDKCLFCVPLNVATIIITLSGAIAAILVIVALLVGNRMGLEHPGAISGVKFYIWRIFNTCLCLLGHILGILVWTRAIPKKYEDARDVILQIFFWLVVASMILQLFFSITLLAYCWHACLTVALTHTAMFLLILGKLDSCCGCASLRVGMLFISVLSMSSGCLMLSAAEQKCDVGLKETMEMAEYYKEYETFNEIQDAPKIRDTLLKQIPTFIPVMITLMSLNFMLCGLILMFATVTDTVGFIQLFVWLIFLNVIVGWLLCFLATVSCLFYPEKCILKNVDWLSASVFVTGFMVWLLLWIYFISVANSHAVEVSGD